MTVAVGTAKLVLLGVDGRQLSYRFHQDPQRPLAECHP